MMPYFPISSRQVGFLETIPWVNQAETCGKRSPSIPHLADYLRGALP